MRKTLRYRSAIAAFGLSFAACHSARALTITPTFDSSITNDPNAAVIEASIKSVIANYETLFLNPINVSVTFQEMTSGLGENTHYLTTDTYSDFRSKLNSSATSANDTLALANLPIQTANPVTGDSNIQLTTSNALALGIFVAPSANPGSTISLNTSIMNLSRTAAQNSNYYDLYSVVSHEMDEVLGLGSVLANGSNGQPAPTGAVSPEDLFRYAAYPGTGSAVRSFTTSSSAAAYFSLDGKTDIAQFNQNSPSTNPADFGDWYSPGTQTPQVQDAFGKPGVILNLGPSEKTALDVIGYTLLAALYWNPTGANPATSPLPDGPGTWTNTGGNIWSNGSSNSTWSNSPVQNAQFGTAGAASTTPYTVTLGSGVEVGTVNFANQNYAIVGNGFSLTIDNGILCVANATVNSPVILGGANSWETVGTATLTVGGNVSGGYAITKQGPGTLVLSGANSYSGGTTVAAGTLLLNSSTALPASGNVIVSGGALDLHGQSPTLGNLTFGDGLSTSAASVIDSGTTPGILTLGGDITYTGTFNGGSSYFPAATISAKIQLASGTHNLTSADTLTSANSYDLVISGALSGSGGLTKGGINYVALTGANSYSGPTIINSGYLFAAATNTLSSASAVTVNSPGVLDLVAYANQAGVTAGSYSQSIGSLAGSGQVTLGSLNVSGNANLTVGGDGTSTTFSGQIIDAAKGGSLTKIGGGTLILSGINGYYGATTINGGTLQINVNGGLSAYSSGVSGLAGATLVFSEGTTSFLVAIPISGGIGVTQAGVGSMYVTGANTYTGTTTISSGSLIVGENTATGSLGSGSVVDNGILYFYRSDNPTFSNPISGSGTIIQFGSGTLTLSGASSSLKGATSVSSGTLLVTGSLAGSAVTVHSGATLGGNGTVGAANVLSGGTLLPGSTSAGALLNTGNLTISSGAHLSIEIGGRTGTGTAAVRYAEVSVTGSVSLGGDAQISLFGGFTPVVNDIFYIILNDGSDTVTGTFSNAVGGIISAGGIQYQVNYSANGDGGSTPNDVALIVQSVPEPGIWTLLIPGMAMGFVSRRHRRSGSAASSVPSSF